MYTILFDRRRQIRRCASGICHLDMKQSSESREGLNVAWYLGIRAIRFVGVCCAGSSSGLSVGLSVGQVG